MSQADNEKIMFCLNCNRMTLHICDSKEKACICLECGHNCGFTIVELEKIQQIIKEGRP